MFVELLSGKLLERTNTTTTTRAGTQHAHAVWVCCACSMWMLRCVPSTVCGTCGCVRRRNTPPRVHIHVDMWGVKQASTKAQQKERTHLSTASCYTGSLPNASVISYITDLSSCSSSLCVGQPFAQSVELVLSTTNSMRMGVCVDGIDGGLGSSLERRYDGVLFRVRLAGRAIEGCVVPTGPEA